MKKGMTYKEIFKRYIDYVKKHYGQNCSVVFDRYSANASTEGITYLRHSKGKLGRTILFTENTVFNMKKDKQCFLEMLTVEMNTVSMCAMQSGGAADTLIATTAVDIANSKPTVVIREDTDLLILLIYFVNKKRYRMFFLMSDKNVKDESKVWSIRFACEQLGQCVCDEILAIHNLLGCDTTSKVLSIGKGAALTKFQKGEYFQQDILLFLKKDVSKAEIKKAGERLLVSLYGRKANNSLDRIRLYKFHQKIASNSKVVQSIYAQHEMLQVSILSECVIKCKVRKKEVT